MSHRLLEWHTVDFNDPVVKQQSLKHVDKMSEGQLAERPFISWSKSLEALTPFGSSKLRKKKEEDDKEKMEEDDKEKEHKQKEQTC